MLCWFLAAPVAILVRAFTTEEVAREPREYCLRRQACYRDRGGETSLPARLGCFVLQKLFYMPTCDYCLSFWVSLVVVWLADYRISFDDWRGSALACFVVMGVANVYLALFALLRVDTRKERAAAKDLEAKRE
ncbi:MAG TPA: hypothetical protein VFW87_26905 [Pirellulales bacterium]|nr:hypothetical protein [Pirellulales bacterium]